MEGDEDVIGTPPIKELPPIIPRLLKASWVGSAVPLSEDNGDGPAGDGPVAHSDDAEDTSCKDPDPVGKLIPKIEASVEVELAVFTNRSEPGARDEPITLPPSGEGPRLEPLKPLCHKLVAGLGAAAALPPLLRM